MSLSTFQKNASSLFKEYGLTLGIGFAFLLPLKLSFAYIFLVPLISLWILTKYGEIFHCSHALIKSLLLFVVITAATALFGLYPLHSLRSLVSLSFFVFTVPVSAYLFALPRGHLILIALLLGQTLAGIHSVYDAAFPHLLPRLFLGKVTESGQIALTLPLATGFLLSLIVNNGLQPWKEICARGKDSFSPLLYGACTSLFLFFLGFSKDFDITGYALTLLAIICAILFLGGIFQVYRGYHHGDFSIAIHTLLASVIIPTILTALLVNLKRGPWVGVLFGGCVLFFLFGRRLIIPALVGALLVITFVDPIRARLADSSRDFFIYGGRNVIWQVGMDLLPRYPLGIGFGNSSVLQKFSAQIPQELKHFHNNFLNIVIETGWLGLLAFLWWLAAIFRYAFSRRPSRRWYILGPTVGCAILSWQIAGIVEYNAGDSEVMLVVYILVGLLLMLSTLPPPSSAEDASSQ